VRERKRECTEREGREEEESRDGQRDIEEGIQTDRASDPKQLSVQIWRDFFCLEYARQPTVAPAFKEAMTAFCWQRTLRKQQA